MHHAKEEEIDEAEEGDGGEEEIDDTDAIDEALFLLEEMQDEAPVVSPHPTIVVYRTGN